MAEKREKLSVRKSGRRYAGGQGLPSQESIELLTKLLQEFERRSSSSGTTLPPEVVKDIAAVGRGFRIHRERPLVAREPHRRCRVTPSQGTANGGTRVCIAGSHLLPGSTVLLAILAAKDVSCCQPDGDSGDDAAGIFRLRRSVDVVVTTLGGFGESGARLHVSSSLSQVVARARANSPGASGGIMFRRFATVARRRRAEAVPVSSDGPDRRARARLGPACRGGRVRPRSSASSAAISTASKTPGSAGTR